MSRHDATVPDPAAGSGRSSSPGARASESRQTQQGPQTLHVSADLRVQVSAPDGRSAQVLVRDDAGTVRVVVARPGDLGVIGASLPGGLSGVASQVARLARQGSLPLPPWDQPVEVSVGPTVVLRRRGGRWAPGVRVVAPVAAAGSLVVLGILAAVIGRRRRR